VVRVDRNFASKHNGATITGPGVRNPELIDDTENTNSGIDAGLGSIVGKGWTVNLHGRHRIASVRVSAENHPPANSADFEGRFSDLRSFTIQVSNNGKTFRSIKFSGKRFFPGGLPRPVVPIELLRTLHFKPVKARFVRLVVKSNQCTGNSHYRDTDNDPLNNADCRATNLGHQVLAAELQVYGPDHKKVTLRRLER
jgi:hypothetical protein